LAFIETWRSGGRRSKHKGGRVIVVVDQALDFASKRGIAVAGVIEKSSAPVERKLDGVEKNASNAIFTVSHEVAQFV